MSRAPGRTLIYIVAFNFTVFVVATLAYFAAGWSATDAAYMVLLTIYSVGYNEVHPITTDYLHLVTILTMVFGCTGMILLTGALVQFLTISQLQQIFGGNRMKADVAKLNKHVIIVGFGRIGLMLAKELKAAGTRFVVLEQDEQRAEEVRELGYLCLSGDGTSETNLIAAGVERARILACVLPNDAANVFITLSARSLNPKIRIIARGELPSTENKLRQAGADKVVLPAHIGAERIAELILYEETSRFLRSSQEMQGLEHSLHGLGLEMEVVAVPQDSQLGGKSVGEIEKMGHGQFFIVQLHRQNGEIVTAPDAKLPISRGDGIAIVGRSGTAARILFNSMPEDAETEPQTAATATQ